MFELRSVVYDPKTGTRKYKSNSGKNRVALANIETIDGDELYFVVGVAPMIFVGDQERYIYRVKLHSE